MAVEDYPFTFNPDACETCNGNCCNGEKGYIWVNRKEIEAISDFLKMETDKFIDTCLRKVGYRYSIKELKSYGNYACLFYSEEKKGCLIYDVRPEQCRTYPFWPFFKLNPQVVMEECPGLTATPSPSINNAKNMK